MTIKSFLNKVHTTTELSPWAVVIGVILGTIIYDVATGFTRSWTEEVSAFIFSIFLGLMCILGYYYYLKRKE